MVHVFHCRIQSKFNPYLKNKSFFIYFQFEHLQNLSIVVPNTYPNYFFPKRFEPNLFEHPPRQLETSRRQPFNPLILILIQVDFFGKDYAKMIRRRTKRGSPMVKFKHNTNYISLFSFSSPSFPLPFKVTSDFYLYQ